MNWPPETPEEKRVRHISGLALPALTKLAREAGLEFDEATVRAAELRRRLLALAPKGAARSSEGSAEPGA
jgi:hypothetical protein